MCTAYGVVANAVGSLSLLLIMMVGAFVLPRAEVGTTQAGLHVW